VSSHTSGRNLLEDSKAGEHCLSYLYLANSGPQPDGLAPLSVQMQPIAEVVRVLHERDSCTVSSHIERVHDSGAGSSNVRSCFRAGWLDIPAKTLDQVGCPREVASNLKQAFIHRTQPGPAISRGAARNAVPDHAETHHQIWAGWRSDRNRRKRRPESSRGLDDLAPSPHHGRALAGRHVEKRFSRERVTVGQ
jgi:hypothetical protein